MKLTRGSLWSVRLWLSAAIAFGVFGNAAIAEELSASPLMQRNGALESQIANVVRTQAAPNASADAAAKAEHPLAPVLRYALETHRNLAATIRDYECRLIKRERIRGGLKAQEMMDLRIRHQGQTKDGKSLPFGVYMNYLAPGSVRGREVLWVAGRNHGNLMATNGGSSNLKTFTLMLPLNSPKALERTNYPISEIGMLNLAERLIEDGVRHIEHDTRRECQVRMVDGAKINGRPCRYIQVGFPEKREGIKFHIAQIFVDSELKMPVRYAAFSWPTTPGGEPVLLEEFTYLNVRPNVGLTERDFDVRNPDYKFFVAEAESK